MLLFINLVFCQGEASIWYFGGNAGLDFNSGAPVVLNDGQLEASQSCGVISNAFGQLLFYSNGLKVWDRNHNVMPNGNGILGSLSAKQSSLIIQNPTNANLYYLFTLSCFECGYPIELRYSEINMTLNEGNGDVTSNKNILLNSYMSEMLTGMKKSDDSGYWLIAHGSNSNNYYAYAITDSGISTPVITSIGPVFNNTWGEMEVSSKFSPDNTKIATAKQGGIALYDFDETTGQLSNLEVVNTVQTNYGIEFSPSGTILYASCVTSWVQAITFQYDLTASNIPSTEIILSSTIGVGDMQIAPDGKIYVANSASSTHLGIINNPDVLGPGCNFVPQGIDLSPGICSIGLPQFIQNYFILGFNAVNTCFGAATSFSPTNSSTITSANWNFGDGSTSSVINPTHTYTNPGTYTVSATFSNGIDTTTHTKEITITEVPIIANNIPNQSICGTANLPYDLSQFNSSVLGTQSATTYGVAYFSSMADAVAHSNSLATNQSLPLGSTTFYVKIYNLNNFSCLAIDDFEVALFEQPVANTPSPYFICETAPYDGIDTFYLTSKNSEILNGQNPANFSITYHPTINAANANTSPLPFTYVNAVPTETLYARIQNNSNVSCFATTTLELKVVQEPTVVTVSDYKVCDDVSNDGFASFDLATKTSEILNGQPASFFEVNYYLTSLDAQNQTNPIASPITNSSNNQEIFYTISANGNISCSANGSFFLRVNSSPIAHPITDFFQCDDLSNNGTENFNLSLKNIEILGNQNASNFSVTYFASSLDAQNNSNPLPYSYTNLSNPQIIFAKITNNQNSNCYAIENFQIGANRLPTALAAQNIITCDDEANNGKAFFDLNLQNASILGSQNPAEYTVTYHSSLFNANAGTNALIIPFENITNPQTIYARVTNNLNALCFAISDFDLNVMEKPILNMKNVYSICEGFTVQVQAPAGFSTYEWSTGETTQNVIIDEPGDYSITVTKDYGTIICESSQDFTVYNSNKATITSIITNDWTQQENTITVLVSGDGVYEYSLNGIDFQFDNYFTGLSAGNYTVYVRDKKGCGTVKEEVFLLSYPKYFTPNADGYNDYWHINFSNAEPKMKVLIFDRYGKLITMLRGGSPGWDGTYNGNLLPATDYWFVIERGNGKEYKGHFSLKR